MGQTSRDAGEHEAVVDVLEHAAVLGRQQVVDEFGYVAPTASEAHVAQASRDFDNGAGLVITCADAVRDSGDSLVGEERGDLFPVHAGLGNEIDLWLGE